MRRRLHLPKIPKERFSLTLTFAGFAFLIFLATMVLTGVIVFVCSRLGWINTNLTGLREIFFISLLNIIVGFGGALLLMRALLKPVNMLMSQMDRLAYGDYKARLDFGKVGNVNKTFTEMSESFNALAQELEGTEMLRSDFINNFSHEFKTPIVSIAGFAKLLKRGDLTPEQQAEYIGIIEEESVRLADMASNVLSLTRVENQTILTDVTRFNLAEQLRSSVLLLENKWARKEIALELNFPELQLCGNEELLKQVWINLLDNAIKFSPERGMVAVDAAQTGETVTVGITNTGPTISPEQQHKIWGKFYQADESHSTEGNGVGLAVVRRIVDLHGGEVSVESDNGMTTFTVELPIE